MWRPRREEPLVIDEVRHCLVLANTLAEYEGTCNPAFKEELSALLEHAGLEEPPEDEEGPAADAYWVRQREVELRLHLRDLQRRLGFEPRTISLDDDGPQADDVQDPRR
jgi:hypothetical protein